MLTPAELAAHFRTSERTVARMVADGCPSIRPPAIYTRLYTGRITQTP